MREPWVTRRFRFDLPVDRIDALLSRLRGTLPRLTAAVRGLSEPMLTRRDGERWSIQEHVGHLHDLEDLHLRRLDEIAAGVEVLTAADMENKRTWEAGHNARPLAAVLADFAAGRAALIEALRALDPQGLARHATHPRLGQPMRAIDVAFFTAEHDDHHLAAIEAMVARAGPPTPAPAVAAPWRALPRDEPMPQLVRHRITGREAMISHVTLQRGCKVPSHAHANEQFACVLSGVVRFVLADGERVLSAGEVLHLPSHAPHSAEALETAVVLDVFAPPSETTGIDRPAG